MLFFHVCLCLCVVLSYYLLCLFSCLFFMCLSLVSIFGGGQWPPHHRPCRFGRGPWGCAAASFHQDVFAVQRAVLRHFRHHAEVDRVGLDWRRFFYARPGELFQRRQREERLPRLHSNRKGNSHGKATVCRGNSMQG